VDYAGLLRAVEAGRTPPVVLVHGAEPVLLDDAVAAITRALFPDPGMATLSREVLEAREAGAETIVRSALTLPFLSDRRLVVVRDDRRHITVPWSVRVALRGGRSTREPVDVVPPLATGERDVALVDRAAAGAAFELVQQVSDRAFTSAYVFTYVMVAKRRPAARRKSWRSATSSASTSASEQSACRLGRYTGRSGASV